MTGACGAIVQPYDTGVLLKVCVKEYPVVPSVSFPGNTIFSKRVLASHFSDQLGKPVNLNQFCNDIDKIEQDYHDKGYILARVTDVRFSPTSINVIIDEGKISAVQITGGKRFKSLVTKRTAGVKLGLPYNDRILANVRRLHDRYGLADIRRQTEAIASPDPAKQTYILKLQEASEAIGRVEWSPFGSASSQAIRKQ